MNALIPSTPGAASTGHHLIPLQLGRNDAFNSLFRFGQEIQYQQFT
jgi:hypothetical protein